MIVHQDKDYLKELIPKLSEFLQSELQAIVHPKKIYLQHYSKGVMLYGTVILPNRIYIARRNTANFYNALVKQNQIARDHKPTMAEQQAFQSSMNSYQGIMKHYNSYKLRKQMILKNLSGWWWNYVYIAGYEMFVMKNKVIRNQFSLL